MEWVRCIRYIPELESLVSACCDTGTGMAITSMHDLKTKYFCVNKGVVCFDYSGVSLTSLPLHMNTCERDHVSASGYMIIHMNAC